MPLVLQKTQIASLINTSIKITKNPRLYQNKLEEFYKTDITEKDKAISFLNLIIENPEDRKIYMDRWESVKDAKVFENNFKKGFAKNRFKKEDFKEIANRTPASMIHFTYSYFKEILDRTNNKGESLYDR